MTEQQPQELWRPAIRVIQGSHADRAVAGRTVIGDADIAHTGIIHVPADRVSADHINADRVDTHHSASGPTGASRQRQAPQPHTPYGFSSATRPPTSGPYAPGPFPTPEARATQLIRSARPMVQDAQRRIIVGIIPVHHGPNKSSGPSPIPAVPDAAIPAVPPDAAPEENRHRGGRHHGDSRRRNRHTSAAVHRRDRRLMTVAKNHISQAPTSRPTATATRLPPTRIRPTPSRPPPSTAWTSGPDTRAW